MEKISKEELRKMERCSPLLPAPGPEVVEQLLGHIYELEHELSALRETQKAREAAVLRLASQHRLVRYGDDDSLSYCCCGWQPISCDVASQWTEHICSLKPDSALDDLLREARRQALEDAGIVAGNTVTEEGRSEALAAIVRREIAALRAPLEPSNR